MDRLDSNYWNKRGNEFARQNLFEDAINCYDNAIFEDDRYYQAWHNKGIILKKMGKIEESQYCLQIAQNIKNQSIKNEQKPPGEINKKQIIIPDVTDSNNVKDNENKNLKGKLQQKTVSVKSLLLGMALIIVILIIIGAMASQSAYDDTTSVPYSEVSTKSQKIQILKQIAENYHNTHTYSLPDRFVCGEMAQDVWNMVKNAGNQL